MIHQRKMNIHPATSRHLYRWRAKYQNTAPVFTEFEHQRSNSICPLRANMKYPDQDNGLRMYTKKAIIYHSSDTSFSIMAQKTMKSIWNPVNFCKNSKQLAEELYSWSAKSENTAAVFPNLGPPRSKPIKPASVNVKNINTHRQLVRSFFIRNIYDCCSTKQLLYIKVIWVMILRFWVIHWSS